MNLLLKKFRTAIKKKYTYYKEHYLNWFNLIKEQDSLNPKKMDEAFFKLGQVIKPLKGLPLSLRYS